MAKRNRFKALTNPTRLPKGWYIRVYAGGACSFQVLKVLSSKLHDLPAGYKLDRTTKKVLTAVHTPDGQVIKDEYYVRDIGFNNKTVKLFPFSNALLAKLKVMSKGELYTFVCRPTKPSLTKRLFAEHFSIRGLHDL